MGSWQRKCGVGFIKDFVLETTPSFTGRTASHHTPVRDCEDEMPGERCNNFLVAMQNGIRRKHSCGDIFTSWIAPRSLYELWSFTSGVTSDLFADCFNDGGILDTYCSEDLQEGTLASTGTCKFQ